jgi:uncharacterized protein YbjT (DUF2867 family)
MRQQRVAVIGATGTAGARTVGALRERGAEVVEVSRSHGVDLFTGKGLAEALDGVDAVVDAANAFPPPGSELSVEEALALATRNLLDAASAAGVRRLVLLSILGIEQPAFDDFAYYRAKRAQEELVAAHLLPSTTVKTSQWFEFATNPAAVEFREDEVVVQDWLIQPIAAASVAAVLAETALADAPPAGPLLLTGPDRVRLPELTGRLMARQGDHRPVRTVPPALPALAEGILLAPPGARIVAPDTESWLATIH